MKNYEELNDAERTSIRNLFNQDCTTRVKVLDNWQDARGIILLLRCETRDKGVIRFTVDNLTFGQAAAFYFGDSIMARAIVFNLLNEIKCKSKEESNG